MRQTCYRAFLGCMLAGWMIVIFLFSAQSAEVSSEVSGSVAYQLIERADRVFGMVLSDVDRFWLVEKLEFPIRKAAHMTEYAILALLAFLFFRSFRTKEKKAYRLSFLLAVIYAGSDEFHQVFVPGREGMFVDVCIDAAGALTALLLFGTVQKLKKRIRGKHCEKKTLPLQWEENIKK